MSLRTLRILFFTWPSSSSLWTASSRFNSPVYNLLPFQDFFVSKWEVDKKKVDPLLKSIKKSDEIFLALDPDREGELIAWHLVEICKEKRIFDGKQFKRIEFSAVRKEDILEAIKNPRVINQNLVNAAITRRFLDRFFGYKISYKKIFAIIRIDRALNQAIKNKITLIKALIYRILGWLGGAFEIYIFLWIIGYDPNIIDVIVIESFSGIIRAVAFFIPAGIGVQELAFVIVGDFVGLNSETSFSIALGRRVREILVGLPAIISWFFIKKKLKDN